MLEEKVWGGFSFGVGRLNKRWMEEIGKGEEIRKDLGW